MIKNIFEIELLQDIDAFRLLMTKLKIDIEKRTLLYHSNQDMRIRTFNMIYRIGSPFSNFLSYAHFLFFNPNYQLSFDGQNPLEAKLQSLKEYFQFIRNGYVYNLCQVTEHSLKRVLYSLITARPLNIWEIRDSIFKELDISLEGDSYNVLKLLFTIKNGIHNNGCYGRKKPDCITYNGSFIKLEYLKKVVYKGDPNYLNITKDIISLFYSILDHPKVKKLDCVPDIF